MRPVLDFFYGIASGLGVRRRARASYQKKARVHAGPRLFRALNARRACVLLLGAAGLALLYVGLTPARGDAGRAAQPPGEAAPDDPLTSVLSVEPGCAPRDWRHIIVHHSASSGGSAAIFDQYHREVNHWHSLGYHFVIGNGVGQGDGVIVPGPRWKRQEAGAHAGSPAHNERGIGICLVGNFEERAPTPAQWEALCALTRRLCRQYEIAPDHIAGHNQVRRGGTACPGKLLSLEKLRQAAAP